MIVFAACIRSAAMGNKHTRSHVYSNEKRILFIPSSKRERKHRKVDFYSSSFQKRLDRHSSNARPGIALTLLSTRISSLQAQITTGDGGQAAGKGRRADRGR
jgi:hypothetical protein